MQSLGQISYALKDIINKLLIKFEAELRRIDRLLKAVEKYMQRPPASTLIDELALKELKNTYNELVNIIRNLSSEFFKVAQEVSYQDIVNDLTELRQKLISICKRFLTEAELAVYEAVCEFIEQGIKDFPHLVREIPSKVRLERTQVVNCLIKLNFKGIIGLEVKL